MRFGWLGLIGLVGFNISLDTYYSVILNQYSPALPLKKKKYIKKEEEGFRY